MARPKIEGSSKGKPMHFSAGAIVKNKKGEILLLDRLNIPLGWACPAGHVDEGESAEKSAIREIKEETGLEAGKRNKGA